MELAAPHEPTAQISPGPELGRFASISNRWTVAAPAPKVFFGGPDRPAGYLRDLLEARVDAMGPGDAIDWMTYYFRDQRLAAALIRAHRRGVAVRVCLEGVPRRRGANDAVIRTLADPLTGIGAGLTVVRHPIPLHLHAKIYAFSGAKPYVLMGSFNPSGDGPDDDPAVAADLGDQDRGHNLLVEIEDPIVVAAMIGRTAAMHAGSSALRLALAAKRETGPAPASGYETIFFPYLSRNPLGRRLERLRPGASVRIAASHLDDGRFVKRLAGLVARGVRVSLLTHHTTRRAPRRIEKQLLRGGIEVARYAHPDGLPMHCKFILVQDQEQCWSAFGSYNLTYTSRWLNQEVLVFSDATGLWSALGARWDEIASEPWAIPSAPL